MNRAAGLGSPPAVEHLPKPANGLTRGCDRFELGFVLTFREVSDRSPCAHVLGISSEFLKSKGSVRSDEDIYASVDTWR
jgi:hypothetical protein